VESYINAVALETERRRTDQAKLHPYLSFLFKCDGNVDPIGL
jgi:hypothetical protein